MAVSANVILRSKPLKKDGTGGLYLRFVLDRKKKDFSLGESIPPSAWDDSKAIVKTRTKTVNAEKLNLFLSKELARANDIILEHKLDDREITIDRFTAAFQGESKAPRDLYEFVRERIIDLRDGNYAYNTIRKYETELSKLKKFRPSLTLKGVDYSFLRDYESYMRNELGNKTNTVQKSMATLRAFINVALKEGLLKEYPFSKFPLRKEASTRLYLTVEEVESLDNLYKSDTLIPSWQNVLSSFLFSCYTGLRFQDLADLRYEDIQNNAIVFKMQKTKEYVFIPITKKAAPLIDLKQKEGKVFRMVTNQKTNEFLKEVMKKAKIKKQISFHCARHTFATIGLTIGIPIEVISKLLGHADLKTTQIYAKIVDHLKVKEMRKWDDL